MNINIMDIELILLRSLVERGETCNEAAHAIYKYFTDKQFESKK